MLARKPRQPTAAECCGDGCAVCVYDIYAQELTIWENECKRELQYGYGRRELQQGSVISPDHYKLFVLQKIRKMTECCSKYTFAINDFGSIGYGIGQHLIMRASVDGEIVTRQYTPVSLPSALGFFEVIIKVYPTGKMSKYIRTLKEGCSVEWRGPLGRLDYKPNMHKHMLMLAAGTGIAPMVQVLRHITSMDDDYTMVHLLFGMAKYRDIYLKDELDELKRFWNVSILYCLSDSSERPRGLRNDDHHPAPCYLRGPLRPPMRLVTTGWQRRDSAHAKSQQARASIGIVSTEIMAAGCDDDELSECLELIDEHERRKAEERNEKLIREAEERHLEMKRLEIELLKARGSSEGSEASSGVERKSFRMKDLMQPYRSGEDMGLFLVLPFEKECWPAEREPFSHFGRRYQGLQITGGGRGMQQSRIEVSTASAHQHCLHRPLPTKVDDLCTSRSRPAAGEAVTKQ
ncbi:hypothetical protein HPB51_004357 [Rhipicephalus microplus]|uniref:cytochrome-b5 reductase n=1 Tax=Rhipicephalus microplus TaxID=6941 RepID=A0A9J6ELV9_RHIMP|nr:hypothetical protein HPB51_004357 [Rhipicephalus microplus]